MPPRAAYKCPGVKVDPGVDLEGGKGDGQGAPQPVLSLEGGQQLNYKKHHPEGGSLTPSKTEAQRGKVTYSSSHSWHKRHDTQGKSQICKIVTF